MYAPHTEVTPTASVGSRVSRSFVFLLKVCLALAGFHSTLQAEPWLSTRFAQNCAGCHAPGRKNVEPKDRRCSLSCQGCHVNPNGGGLRSFYGKWNEERWLKSFVSKGLKSQPSTAPINEQVYKKGSKKLRAKYKKKDFRKAGFELKTSPESHPDEALYDRTDGMEHEMATSKQEVLFQIPEKDPYRLFEQSKVDGGADLRYLVYSGEVTSGDTSTEVYSSFLMAADLALRYRPVYRDLHVVWEGRASGSPRGKTTFEDTMLDNLTTRSLYVMVDNLPYNVFVMGGLYRPLIGQYSPDHKALVQQTIARAFDDSSQNLTFRAVSVGTAPNVPYANVHWIAGQKIGSEDVNVRGFATNLGLRFVKLSGSINYTYWRTEKTDEQDPDKVEIQSISGGMKLGPVTGNLELVSVARERPNTDFRRGGLISLETYTRVWRENYLVLNYQEQNTNTALQPGSASQIRTGVRSFLLSGVDLSLLYEIDKINTDADTQTQTPGSTRESEALSAQLHLYF